MLIATAWAALALSTSLSAVDVPWGKGETLGEKKALSATTVCTDGKNHFVAVAPHEHQGEQLFYGDGKTFAPVLLPPGSLPGSDFFEPRFFSPKANSDFRGMDMRVYSSVDVKPESCDVACGEKTQSWKKLDAATAKDTLVKAKYEENPQQYRPSALLRDTKGNYYLVEQGIRSGQEKSFRLWVGPKGKLVQQKMVNVVSDSEGQIFSTQAGELRLIIDRVDASYWIKGKDKSELRTVPLQDNWPLVYNDLGVYRGARLGTPCDDI